MPSYSSRSSTVDGDYDSWDQPSSDSKKKSRSKLPVEDKLSVSSQMILYCLSNFLTGLQKRRDQNRVSQRAFRQRKEKHTKELELKVEELENLLESASHENSLAASQMSRMEEELCYYRRLLFAGNGAPVLSPPSSEKSTAAYTSNYTTSYATMPGAATTGSYSTNYTTSPHSNSSSAHSSPDLGNIQGDFGGANEGVESFWGYEVPQTPSYQQFSTPHTGQGWQGTQDGW